MKGKTKHPLYKTWSNMIARCEIPGASQYSNYGGRGISVCDLWRNSFDAFVEDMGERPAGYSIDRIDVNGNYEPTNCRWASRNEQARNTQKARLITIDGKSFHVAELQEKYGVNMRTIAYRAGKGMSFDQVISHDKLWNNYESQKKAVAAHADKKRSQTHCKRGHLLSEDNVYLYKGTRSCRACRKAMDRYLYYKKQRPIEDFL